MIKPTYRKFALLFLFSVAGAVTVNAQNPAINSPYNQVSIASPTAASLGKYADIPVNNHTGIPEISIPLYTIKEGPLTLPISLSYHGGGISVMEPASWVGTGWSLNAGGVITRQVQGGPDVSGTGSATYGHFSHYGFSSYSNVGNGGGQPGPFEYAFEHDLYDGEPDLYTFNFNGYVGKFYFSDDRTPVLVNGDDLKIDYYYPREDGLATSIADLDIQGFIITVPTGDKYYFGITDNLTLASNDRAKKPVEMTFPFSSDHEVATEMVFSSYYLNKIVAADGVHTINLTYASEKYSYYTVSMFPIPDFFPTIDQYGHPLDPFVIATRNEKEYRLVSNNIDGVRLTQISFSNGTIDFNPSTATRTDLEGNIYVDGVGGANTQAKALDNIAIRSSDYCKKFSFSYGYFGGDNTVLAAALQITNTNVSSIQTDKRRLKLQSILEETCDGTIAANPWRFDYYSNFLPRRLSFAQDHWGYYNGQNSNNALGTLIPTYTINTFTTVDGANRDAAWPAMAQGTLTKITYPTGGSSSFVFEPNDVWVDYKKNNRSLVKDIAVGPGVGQHSPQTFTIDCTKNPYLFTIDFNKGGSSPIGIAELRGLPAGSAGLYANKDHLHDEVVVYPGEGTRSYELVINDFNVTGSSVSAEVRVYELTDYVHENALAGGIRIQKNTTTAGPTAPDMVTTYAYRQNGKSTGTLYSRPRYVSIIRNAVIAEYGFYSVGSPTTTLHSLGCVNPNTSPGFSYMKSPCGILPMSTTQGHHIGYDQVTVAQSGNGRTDYYYHNTDYWKRQNSDDVAYRNIVTNFCDTSIPFQPAVPLPFDFSRGQLKQEMVFDESGQFVKDRQYTYQYDSSKTVTPVFLVKSIAGYGLNSYYERKSYWRKQMQVIENTIAPSGFVQTTKLYKYDSPYHRQLTQLTETASAGDVLETKNKLVFDFRVATSDNIDNGLTAYNNACATCEATRQYEITHCPSNDCFLGHLNFVACRASARRAYIAYRRTNFSDRTNAFQTTHNAAKNNADSRLKSLLQLQDDYTNTLVETSHWKNGQLLNASYTTFGPGVTPSATVYPAQVFALSLATPAATFAPAAVSGNSIGTDNRYAATPETSLKFDKGNLVELLPKNGVVTSYVWGYGNTLPIVQATGVSQATLSAAYISAGGNLTTLRAAPALAKALLTTYAHRPLVGLANQTDATGRTVTYEYDALGRLVRARDEQGRILSQQQYHYAGQ